MAFGAIIRADSLSPYGNRLTTFEVTHPRYVLAEVNTHRMLSRNSASSRAIPVATLLQRIKDDPYTPVYWGSNKKGMQAGEELDEAAQKLCLDEWLAARDDAMRHAGKLRELGLHKQDANRLLEPFMWHTAIITATEWDNFWHLRNHPDAHPAFQTVAAMMQELYEENEPEEIDHGDWHLPMIGPEDYDAAFAQGLAQQAGDSKALVDLMVKVSIGRCARVSHLTHDGKRDLAADVDLTDTKLTQRGHMSPLEHAARPAHPNDFDEGPPSEACHFFKRDVRYINDAGDWTVDPENLWFGNFRGWVQFRKTIAFEHDPLGPRA